MAWSKVQSLANQAGGTPVTKAFTASAVNNLLVVWCGTGSNTSGNPTISDTQTNTWNAILGTPVALAGAGKGQGWWALAKNTSASTITCSATSPGGFMNLLFDEFSGNLTSGTVLGAALAGSGSGTPTFGAITTTGDQSLIYAACNDSVTAVGSGFTKGADDTVQDWSEYKILGSGTSGSSQSATFTGSGSYIGLIAEFLIAGGGGGGGGGGPFPFFRRANQLSGGFALPGGGLGRHALPERRLWVPEPRRIIVPVPQMPRRAA